MGVEEIIKNIEERANQEVQEINKQAQEEKNKILERAKQEALRVREGIVKRMEKEAELAKREQIIKARVEEKKKLLDLKRVLLVESFNQAEEELRNLDRQEYMSLMKRLLLSNIGSGNEEIVVSPRDQEWMKGEFLEELKDILEKKGRWNKVKLTVGLKERERGFILKKEGINLNYTFSNLFSLLREELEIEVANTLLG